MTARRRCISPALAVLLLFPFAAGACLFSPEKGPETGDLKVLFIGSSYFAAWDMVDLFSNLAEKGGHDVYVDTFIKSGVYLDYLAQLRDVTEKIQAQDWDYVVLQGCGITTAYPYTHHLLTSYTGYHPVFPALQTFRAKVTANCVSTRLVFQMPFAFEDGMLWVGMDDTYFDMQQLCYDHTLAWADSLDLVVAPAGWAWRSIMLEAPELHYLYASDYNHPSLRGSYLNACVFYATLFRESCTGIQYYAGIPRVEARHLQEVGSETVLENLNLWNLSGITPRRTGRR